MNANQFKVMICKLREHIITAEGDFVPSGTPVLVAGWADGEEGKKVTVRTMAYMWCDTFTPEEIEDCRDGGCVGSGLWIDVLPSNLLFSEMRTETKIGVRV